MRTLKVVNVPSIKQLIVKSPGFAKKGLSTYKLDLMALCGFGCSYCSSNDGNYLRMNRAAFAALTEAQLGERLLPSTAPDLTFAWPDAIQKLSEQIGRRGKGFGEGETLVFSMLTDAFSGVALKSGATAEALRMLIDGTSFRIRILTKNSIVGTSSKVRGYLAEHADRVVVGLSCGTLDDKWARQVEIGCPPPLARVAATTMLQDAGVPTFGMLCPVFPDVLEGDRLERLVDAVRPLRCETIWWEPYNDRSNWPAVRDGYDEGTFGRRWFTDTYERENRRAWSRYAADLYVRIRDKARAEGWADRMKYLLYEEGIAPEDAPAFAGLEGVLLQDSPADDGRSRNPAIAALQPSVTTP
jgi:DNA repair photolyase